MELGVTKGCKIIATGLGGGENNKATYVAFDVEAPDGEIATIRLYTSLGAWPYTEGKLRQLGWDSTERRMAFEEFNEPDNVTIGATVDVLKKEEEDERTGRVNVKHDFWFPQRAQAVAPEKAKTLAEAMRQQVAPPSGGFDWNTGA